MLKIIFPQEQHYYQARIDLLLGMMRWDQPLPLTLEEQKISTFIVGEATLQDAEFLRVGDIYGGALLYKRDIKDLPPSFQTLMPGEKMVWTSVVTLFINPKGPSLEKDELDGCQMFYKELREKFCEFGKKSGIQFLCLTLSPTEYRYTKQKGLWPYAFEVAPEDSPDGLFHGVLPLSLQKRKPNKKGNLIQQPPLAPSLLRAA